MKKEYFSCERMTKKEIIRKVLADLADIEAILSRSGINPIRPEQDKTIKTDFVKGQSSVLREMQRRFLWVK